MLKKRTKKLKINSARSMNNGIIFYSKRHKGYLAIATVDEQGNITSEWMSKKEYKNKYLENIEPKEFLGLLLSFLAFMVIEIFLVEYISDNYFIQISLIVLASIEAFILRCYNDKKFRPNVHKFHSAEHMVINACQKLNKVPTIEELSNYSRFDNTCGTNIVTLLIVNNISLFFCSFISDLFYMCVAIIFSFVIIMILLKNGFLNFLQIFITAPPTDRELQVAIAGMTVWLENEQKEKERCKFLKFLQKLFQRFFL